MADLTTLDEIREEAGIPAEETEHDLVLTRLLEVASEQLRARYACNFSSVETITAEPHYQVLTNEVITLKRIPVVSITSVNGYAGMTSTAEALNENEHWKLIDPESGLLEFLITVDIVPTGLETSMASAPGEWARVEVAYTAGYTTTPASASRACAMLVAHWFGKLGRDQDLKSFRVGDLNEDFYEFSAWPPTVLELMSPYTRERMGVI
jgi:hypothetical protein